MTLKEIKGRLEMIRGIAGDDESAHIEEDRLMEDFIKFVSTYEHDKELSEMAAEVLKSNDINFSRWCA